MSFDPMSSRRHLGVDNDFVWNRFYRQTSNLSLISGRRRRNFCCSFLILKKLIDEGDENSPLLPIKCNYFYFCWTDFHL